MHVWSMNTVIRLWCWIVVVISFYLFVLGRWRYGRVIVLKGTLAFQILWRNCVRLVWKELCIADVFSASIWWSSGVRHRGLSGFWLRMSTKLALDGDMASVLRISLDGQFWDCDDYVVDVELLGASSVWHRCGCMFVFVSRLPVWLVSTPSTCLHPFLALFRATTYSRGRRITDVVICVCVGLFIVYSFTIACQNWIVMVD